MTLAKFLDDCATRFEQPPFSDRLLACQCRSYAMIALNLEEADRLRREAAALAAKEVLYRKQVAFREGVAEKERKKRVAK